MSRLDRRNRLQQTALNLPPQQSIGPAVLNVARTAEEFITARATEDRLKEATEAAQALSFERDSDGNIIPPQLPEANGLFGPSIYDDAYTQQVIARYGQQINIDGAARLQQIAEENRLNPAGFQTAAQAYIDATTDNALPQVAGDARTSLEQRAVTHFNHIVRQRSEFDFQGAANTHTHNATMIQEDLIGLITSGADFDLVLSRAGEYLAQVEIGHERGFYDASVMQTAPDELQRTMATAYLARDLSDIPNTPIGNAQFIERMTAFQEGEGTITVPIGDQLLEVNVADVFPSPDERQIMAAPVIEMVRSRENARSATTRAVHQAQTLEFQRWLMSGIGMQILNGEGVQDTQLRTAYEEAASAGNVQMMNMAAQMLQQNFENVRLEGEAQHRDDVTMAHLEFLREVYSDVFTDEQIDTLNGWLHDSYGGVTIFQLMNGDPGESNLRFHDIPQAVNTAVNMLQMVTNRAGTGETAFTRRFFDQYREREAARGVATQDALRRTGRNFEDMTPEERQSLNMAVNRQIGGWDLPQTEESAEWMHDTYNDIAGREINWRTDPLPELDAFVDQVVAEFGVMPRGAVEYMRGVVNAYETGNQEQLDRILDLGRIFYEHPSLQDKFEAQAALGPTVGGALEYIYDNFSAGSVTADNARVIFERALRNENFHLEWSALEPEGREKIVTMMDEAMREEFITWFGGGQTISTINRVRPGPLATLMPAAMQQQVFNEIRSRAGQIDPDNPEAFGRHVRASVRAVAEQNGWVLSRLGVNEQRFAQAGDDQPTFGWSQFAPEAFYRDQRTGGPDGDVMEAIESDLQEVLDAYSGRQIDDGRRFPTLRAGQNAGLYYNAAMSSPGIPVYNIMVTLDDGRLEMLTDDEQVFGDMLTIQFNETHARIVEGRERALVRAQKEEVDRREAQRAVLGSSGASGVDPLFAASMVRREASARTQRREEAEAREAEQNDD